MSKRFQSASVTRKALHAIASRPFSFPPAELVRLAREYEMEELIRPAFRMLLDTPLHELNDNDCQMIGWRVYRELTLVKEAITIHRKIVATEAPKLTHSPECRNNELCMQDWEGIWWNGMGRLLMDPYISLSYDEAFRRFQTLEFGEMEVVCKQAALQRVDEGQAFLHTVPLVSATISRLTALLFAEAW